MDALDEEFPEPLKEGGPQEPSLFWHWPDPHQPVNVNELHKTLYPAHTFNQRMALYLTELFQSMPSFWILSISIVLWMLMNVTFLHVDPPPFPLLLTLTALPQLPLQALIMISQSVLSKRQELLADEQYEATKKVYNEIEQMREHLYAQDTILVGLRDRYLAGTAGQSITAEELAMLFHNAYVKHAPTYQYATLPYQAVPWNKRPEANRRLMIAVATDILNTLKNKGV